MLCVHYFSKLEWNCDFSSREFVNDGDGLLTYYFCLSLSVINNSFQLRHGWQNKMKLLLGTKSGICQYLLEEQALELSQLVLAWQGGNCILARTVHYYLGCGGYGDDRMDSKANALTFSTSNFGVDKPNNCLIHRCLLRYSLFQHSLSTAFDTIYLTDQPSTDNGSKKLIKRNYERAHLLTLTQAYHLLDNNK